MTHDRHTDDGSAATLEALDVLVGTWDVTGEATGRVIYRWLPGRRFLVQEGHLDYDGHRNEFLEVIGRRKPLGQEAASEVTSCVYTGSGDTLDYTHDVVGDQVTIWFGDRGSDNLFVGTLSADGTVLDGAWSWPGGGYATTATRVG